MDGLNLLLRGIAIGALFAVALAMARGPKPTPARGAGVLFCVAVAGFLVHTNPEAVHAVGALAVVAWLLSAAGTAYVWLFGVTLFSDKPFVWQRVLPVTGMTALSIIGHYSPPDTAVAVEVAHNVLEVVLMAHLLFVIWRDGRDDLVDSRRAFRVQVLVAVSILCVVLSGFDAAWSLGFQPAWVKPAQAAALTLFVLAGSMAFLQTSPLLFDRPQTVASAALPSIDEARVADKVTLQKLTEVMEEGEVWRRMGLTVGALAETVGVPEHRLRKLINQELGYRNFSDFLNARRITVAKDNLADPNKARVSIATIAFDLGYSSLGPFNRAFRDLVGQTPSEWRRSALAPLARSETSSPLSKSASISSLAARSTGSE